MWLPDLAMARMLSGLTEVTPLVTRNVVSFSRSEGARATYVEREVRRRREMTRRKRDVSL